MRKLLHGFKSDETLMLNYQQGDSSAFEVLYGRHKDALVAFLYRLCGNAGLVEDLAQETWIAVIRGAERYQVKASFKTYLYQIGRNKMVDYWRKPRREDDIDPELAHGEDHSKRPDDALFNTQVQGLLSRAILALPFEQREAFLLREAGFSQQDIAALVDAGGETVKSRLRYASKHLKQHLSQEQNFDPQQLTEARHDGSV